MLWLVVYIFLWSLPVKMHVYNICDNQSVKPCLILKTYPLTFKTLFSTNLFYRIINYILYNFNLASWLFFYFKTVIICDGGNENFDSEFASITTQNTIVFLQNALVYVHKSSFVVDADIHFSAAYFCYSWDSY